jgi:hypothetical protein
MGPGAPLGPVGGAGQTRMTFIPPSGIVELSERRAKEGDFSER